MENQLEVKQQAGALAQLPSLEEFGMQEVSSNDIIIPYVQLIQPMSDKATDGKAMFGELRDSMTNELLGNFSKPLEFVPFFMETLWVEYAAPEREGDQKKFLRILPVVKDPKSPNYNDDWKYMEGSIVRDRMMNFYVMLTKDLAAGGGMPFIISFRRSSLQAGKKLATQMFVKNRASGKLPTAVACNLVVRKESNDKGTFAVMDVEPSREASVPEQQAAIVWLKPVKEGKTKRDDREIVGEPDAVVEATETTQF